MLTYVTAWTSNKIRALQQDSKGVTALEYGVIAVTTVLVTAAAMLLIGPQITATFGAIAGALTPA